LYFIRRINTKLDFPNGIPTWYSGRYLSSQLLGRLRLGELRFEASLGKNIRRPHMLVNPATWES
jgi:hypothetical protein